MQFTSSINFEFSGCSYHQESAFDFQTALQVLNENNVQPHLDYQVWAFRDLVLEIANDIASQWSTVEQKIRDDVASRNGYPNGISPNPARPEGTMFELALIESNHAGQLQLQ
jgi:hypothetical protein